ncbi:MAG TPA: sigma-70 family RNA polymerase sigma factor [Pirellulales bacterium]|nr:sigma-70 family RNA polymerase sigma factor [Pirellulales bacterium]
MNASAIDSTIIDALNRGDLPAIEKVFLAYEPLLRMVIRRRMSAALRAKFDSVDVVQSVWTDLWEGFRQGRWIFQSPEQLRAFLVKATVNRLTDRVRHLRRCMATEERLSRLDLDCLAAASATPSEMVQAGDVWKQLRTHCPAEHGPLLELKRQGLSIVEIAARVGLHESSVRRILGQLRRRFQRSRDKLTLPTQQADSDS